MSRGRGVGGVGALRRLVSLEQGECSHHGERGPALRPLCITPSDSLCDVAGVQEPDTSDQGQNPSACEMSLVQLPDLSACQQDDDSAFFLSITEVSFVLLNP